MNTPVSAPVQTKRAYSLDALRGLAILLMVLSGRIPWGHFPRWMYHGYYVPPDMNFTLIPGITWVDLVFPFFIFAMGAAFPLALHKRLARGMSKTQLIRGIIKRGLLLVAFAIYNQHFMVWTMAGGAGERVHYFFALMGFILMFALWGRFPWKISKTAALWLKIAALMIVVIIFSYLSPREEQFFAFLSQKSILLHGLINLLIVGALLWGTANIKMPSWLKIGVKIIAFLIVVRVISHLTELGDSFYLSIYRNNIILHILANLSVIGALIWLFTHTKWNIRLGLTAVFLAINLSYRVDGSWINIIGTTHTLPFFSDILPYRWLYNLSWLGRWNYLKYLFIIIPGTLCGDLLVTWITEKEYSDKIVEWSKGRLTLIACMMFGFNILVITLLYLRLVLLTTVISLAAGYIGYKLVKNHRTSIEKLIFKLYCWGYLWYIIGIFLDPFEGGVTKGPPATLSYYFITAGLAYFLIIAFCILIDLFQYKKGTTLLVENGQNPMIAYVGYSNLVLPIIGLIGIVETINQFSPEWGLVYGIAATFVVAFIVKGFTRLKIFLRT